MGKKDTQEAQLSKTLITATAAKYTESIRKFASAGQRGIPKLTRSPQIQVLLREARRRQGRLSHARRASVSCMGIATTIPSRMPIATKVINLKKLPLHSSTEPATPNRAGKPIQKPQSPMLRKRA